MVTTQDDVRTGPGTGSALIAFGLFAILAVGAYTIGQNQGENEGPDALSDGGSRVNASAIMGERHYASQSADFRRADIATVMGQCRVDLSEAGLDAAGGVVDAFVLFGHAVIRVPADWKVESGTTVAMGAIENRTHKAGADPAKRLRINGLVLFGALTVIN
jgi:predicted membrane protein